MDLNELLSYKPTKRAGEKRPREGSRGNVAPSSKTVRSQAGGNNRIPAANVIPAAADLQSQAPSIQDNSSVATLDLNGISYEEKLRLLQTIDVEEEDLGQWMGGRCALVS